MLAGEVFLKGCSCNTRNKRVLITEEESRSGFKYSMRGDYL